jgi:hypothetical protein
VAAVQVPRLLLTAIRLKPQSCTFQHSRDQLATKRNCKLEIRDSKSPQGLDNRGNAEPASAEYSKD